MKYTLEATDILDVQQQLHEIESRDVPVPDAVWGLFWRMYENRADREAWTRVVEWVGGV